MAVPDNARICVAKIGAAHGVRGEMRLWPFTEDPLAVADYGPLESQDGKRRFEVATLRPAKVHLVVRFKGIETRDDAEALVGVELYVARSSLPPTGEDEFLHADLIGLVAAAPDGEAVGEIVAVHNFGAGDLIELKPTQGGPTLLLPFSKAVLPEIDLAARRAVVVLPNEIGGDEDDDADVERQP